jgi:DNA uptake protein ComE-like DNA-binding protein
MKWIKQIFGIKPDEDDVDVQSLEKFSNATKTNELVISPNTKSKADLKKLTKSSLNKLTKVILD